MDKEHRDIIRQEILSLPSSEHTITNEHLKFLSTGTQRMLTLLDALDNYQAKYKSLERQNKKHEQAQEKQSEVIQQLNYEIEKLHVEVSALTRQNKKLIADQCLLKPNEAKTWRDQDGMPVDLAIGRCPYCKDIIRSTRPGVRYKCACKKSFVESSLFDPSRHIYSEGILKI